MHRFTVALVLVLSIASGSRAQSSCQCPPATTVASCTASTPAARSFDDVFTSASALDGHTVTVRATLHRFFSCAYRTTRAGCEPMCGGQAALIESAPRADRVIYLDTGDPAGAFGCSGTESCPCCRVDARDQTVVVTGVLRAAPTVRIESPVVCAASR